MARIETPARRSSRVISVRRFEFFQPIAVLAAARYWGAATTYSLLSPKISNASSRIGRSSGKIGKDRAAANAATFVMLDRDLRPVLNFQARNSGELRHIVCYENKAIAKADGSNLQIVRADNLALEFKFMRMVA